MERIPYFDAHCDTVYRCYKTGEKMLHNSGHVALDRVDVFSAYAQVFTFFYSADEAPAEGMLSAAKGMHDLFLRELEQNSIRMAHCRTAADVKKHAAAGKVCAILSIEGADLLECNPDNIEMAADWGVRLLNPTWNFANALSGTHCQESDRGLSDRGRAFVRQSGEAGILMDVSHISEKGFWDLVRMTEKPIVASHSNSRAVFDHSRGLTDDQFRAICETGGVVGLNFCAEFVAENPTMDNFVRHLEHFLDLGGEKHVGMGGDLDGIDEAVAGIHAVQDVPKFWNELVRRGYPRNLLEDLFWNNWLRMFS